MNDIGKTLKRLREEKGWTQEHVANTIGLTRQAISSYESGRTRPDVEMLGHLAELYGKDINDIIYGSDNSLRRLRSLKLSAYISAAVMILGQLLVSAVRCLENIFLSIPDGTVIDSSNRAVIELRSTISRVLENTENVVYLIFTVGCLLTLILYTRLIKPLSLKTKFTALAIFTASLALVTLPLAFADKIYGLWNYIYLPVSAVVRAVILVLLSFFVDFFRKHERKDKR